MGVDVSVGVEVSVCVGVSVGVLVGVSVGVCVCVGVDVILAVGVGVIQSSLELAKAFPDPSLITVNKSPPKIDFT